MESLLYGRELLKSELPQNIWANEIEVITNTSYFNKAGKIHCKRCHSQMKTVDREACNCGNLCGYCRNCLQMGKVKMCSTFYHLPEPNAFQPSTINTLAWEGTLSPQQSEASQTIVETIKKNETRLLWAVAGAGKTEMLFQGIEYALNDNKRICIASPRVDVCLELAPRFQKAFPKTPLALLHGGMEEPYKYTQLVIATTHQLFRFHEAFDVLIIDEIDAFPFHLDESLQFAAGKARKQESSLIYLSATPSPKMQKEVKDKKLHASILPARYHGHQLPVPHTRFFYDWRQRALKTTVRTKFAQEMDKRIQNKKKFLIFMPNIEWMKKFEQVLRIKYPNVPFEAVSAEDPLRKEKVLKMRENNLQFLITSTILERGVTFPNIDVLVIGAEDRVFTESALVQIAGRAGRSPKYPTGEVLFFHNGQSQAIKKAIRQIKSMNQLARKRGLLNE